ncbi:TRP47 family tandem repeat effector [Ehrlichia ruminantium]|uniref:TRP47 family tandem repeat effector n=1 Tax=Ehrlichia ruminantium TaxID=779 RepID=UPI001FB361DB|nr:TRP47 family tandem repeat effector [Ehrlichia ruminantium]
MVHSTAEDCMLHLTTRIDNINFGNDLSIYSNDQFSVSNGNITMEIGYHAHDHEEDHEEDHEDHHGEYHVMFTSNGHVLSDFHGVTGKHIALDVLNHSLQASFVVNLMEPFSEFLQQGSNFSLNLYPLREDSVFDAHNHVHHVMSDNGVVSVLNTNSEGNGTESVASSTVSEGNGTESVASSTVSEGNGTESVASSTVSEGNGTESVAAKAGRQEEGFTFGPRRNDQEGVFTGI